MDDFFDQGENSMPRIGDLAPAFRSVTTQGTMYFSADYSGKWVILFNYPTDFTPAAVRAVFFIDTECKIRALIQYPLSLNLNFDELKRVIVTLQTEDEAISPPAKSFGIAKKLLETKKVSKKFNEWNFCT